MPWEAVNSITVKSAKTGWNGIPVNYAYNPVYNPGNNFGTIIDPSLCIKDLGMGAREYYDFQPRLGAAYRVQSKTVLRSGFGIFFTTPSGPQRWPV